MELFSELPAEYYGFILFALWAVIMVAIRTLLMQPHFKSTKASPWWLRDGLLILAACVLVALGDVITKQDLKARDWVLIFGVGVATTAVTVNILRLKKGRENAKSAANNATNAVFQDASATTSNVRRSKQK